MKKTGIMEIGGYSAEKDKDGRRPIEDTGYVVNGKLISCRMRKNQAEVFNKYRQERFLLIEEPPGAGKSTSLKFCLTRKLIDDPKLRAVILIPQTFIKKTFDSVKLKYPDGSDPMWGISENLCVSNKTDKIESIIKFLNKKSFKGDHDPNAFQGRILIATHAAWSQAHPKIKNKKKAYKNTIFVIDEAHHVLCPEDGETETANKIGDAVHYIMEMKTRTTSIWFSTATYLRGDKCNILPEKYWDRFKHHFLPLDDHWRNNINYIESFGYDFVVYNGDPIIEIKKILKIKKNRKPLIIYCPYIGKLLDGSDKYKFVERLIKAILSVWKNANIVDLVTEEGREQRKKEVLDDEMSERIDVILNARIFDEGADWKFAEQIFDLTPSDSLRIAIQRQGRLWRDLIGKKHINYYAFLPFVKKCLDEDGYRELLSKNYTTLVASMLLRETIEPINTRALKHAASQTKSGKTSKQFPNHFLEAVPDNHKRRDILNQINTKLLLIKNAFGTTPSCVEIEQRIETILLENSVKKKDVKNVTLYIAKMLRRLIPKRKGEDISWLVEKGFDKVWKNEVFDSLLSFGVGCATIKDYDHFRELYADDETRSNEKTHEVCQWIKARMEADGVAV